MTFTILGTAAAEGWPAPWCNCNVCRAARRKGGKNLRRRAAYQVGDRVHIDFGPDSYQQMLDFGLRYELMEHLLITHSHPDHFCPSELRYRRSGFSSLSDASRLVVHGGPEIERALTAEIGPLGDCKAEFDELRPFCPVHLADGITAWPVIAHHAKKETAYNFLLARNGRGLLQGNDTGLWQQPTWDFLKEWQLNAVLLDCTHGPRPPGEWHLGVHHVVRVRDTLDEMGALAPNCRVVATHFSHNGGWLHDDLRRFLEPRGIEVAYDGMSFEL